MAACEPSIAGLSEGEARAARTRLERLTRRFVSATAAAAQERRMALAGTRELLSGRCPARLLGLADSPLDSALFRMVYPKTGLYSRIDRALQELVHELSKPYPDQRPVRVPTEPRWGITLSFQGGDDETTLGSRFTANTACLRLLKLELALLEYRLRVGRYPERLPDLAPGTIGSVPVDPFSEQPFHYRRRAAGYLLFSVGPDRVDDGGRILYATKLKPESRGDLVAGKLFPPAAASHHGRTAGPSRIPEHFTPARTSPAPRSGACWRVPAPA